MPLDKRPSNRVGTVAVTFRVPADVGASSAALLGEFTDWTPVPMAPNAEGGHEVTVELPGGASYRFRYLLDDSRWANDWAADDYVANDFGSDDSVVIVDAATATSGNGDSAPEGDGDGVAAGNGARATASNGDAGPPKATTSQ